MRIPESLPTLPQSRGDRVQSHNAARSHANRSGVAQAGCCAQVCVPLVGCHCVAESPFC
jgi:hypothetical protein